MPGTGIIEKDQKIKTTVFDQYNHPLLLVFFGYVGCTHICSPRLAELDQIYSQLSPKKAQKNKRDIGVVFVNLIKLPNPEAANLFAKNFNPDFNGLYPEKQRLTLLKAEFNVYIEAALTDKNNYNHSALLFLLRKKTDGYYLQRIYTASPFDQKLIVNDIKKNFL